MPKISIIVPIYKVEQYLHRCVDSILAQTFTDFECILVDDGSPDNCGAICDEYAKKDKRIRVIHKPNGGLSDARNAGIDIAKGEFLGLVDSDDWIHPQMYEILYKGIVENNVKLSVCAYEETDLEKEFEHISEPKFEVCRGMDFLISNNVTAVVAWNKLYHRSLFEDIRYPVGKLHEDEFTTYKILYKAGSITYCCEKLYMYFINNNGITKLEHTLRSVGNKEELRKRKEAFIKRRIDRLEALKERVDFFKNKDESAYRHSLKEYKNYLIHDFKVVYGGDVPYLDDKGEIVRMINNGYYELLSYCNKYEKLYFFMIRHNLFRKWIAQNDFEPIQNIIRRIRNIK